MKSLTLISLILIFTSCSHHSKNLAKSNTPITKNLNGHSYGPIYFSAQPQKNDLQQLKAEGFVAVINLRKKNEGSYNEEWESKIIKEEGLAYYNLPFDMKKKLTNEYIDSITAKVIEHKDKGKVLVHCSSGNRVGVWLGAHFKKDHGYSNKKSLKLAKEMGITKPGAEEKLKDYLQKNQ